jgi:hypothetical protein
LTARARVPPERARRATQSDDDRAITGCFNAHRRAHVRGSATRSACRHRADPIVRQARGFLLPGKSPQS